MLILAKACSNAVDPIASKPSETGKESRIGEVEKCGLVPSKHKHGYRANSGGCGEIPNARNRLLRPSGVD